MKLPPPDNNALLTAMREAMKARKLQAVPAFEAKALQLHEMVIVRHGVMLVGQSFGPKTSVYQVRSQCIFYGCTGRQGSGTYVHPRIHPRAEMCPQSFNLSSGQSSSQIDGV